MARKPSKSHTVRRSKPTTVRFWTDDEEWIKRQARQRRVALSVIVDEAMALYRKQVDAQRNGAQVFDAVARAEP